MKSIPVSKNDVVSMDASHSLIGVQTFKLSELAGGLKQRWGTEAIETWLLYGVECELLKSSGGGWHSGKIRIRFEFIPNEQDLPPAPINNCSNSNVTAG
jgi:hypothetical protein